MTGNLEPALIALLSGALPALFGGAAPLVRLAALAGEFTLDPSSTDAEAGQPRSDEAQDALPFDAARPEGPYTLSRPPDASVRKVRLTTAAGDRIALHDAEVAFDAADARRFTLALRPSRDLGGVNGVLVRYGVTAVYATLRYVQELSLDLTLGAGAAGTLERAQALAMAVLALNRGALVEGGAKTEQADAYGAQMTVKALHFAGGGAPAADLRRIRLRAEFELKGVRALADGEGAPIVRIRSPGADGARPVDIRVQADA